MGIVGLVGGYETIYGGDANRINNVQLVSRDRRHGHRTATFSFSGTTGERTERRASRRPR
jgi:hypothetical protein